MFIPYASKRAAIARFCDASMIGRVIAGIILGALLAVSWDARGQVPREANKYRGDIVKNARLVWGLDAPIADFAAQIQKESSFLEDAQSYAGAQGLAQFMPATAKWIAGVYPEELGGPAPLSPSWALRAFVRYDRHLWDRTLAATDCDRMAMTLSAYNGGGGYVTKDQADAVIAGVDPMRWFGAVETIKTRGRSESNWRENRDYPKRILRTLAPRYVAAGWGNSTCKP